MLHKFFFEKFVKITNISYFKKNVNLNKRVKIDGVFLGLVGLLLGLAGLLLRISLGLCPASPRKTPSNPPLLLGLTQCVNILIISRKSKQLLFLRYCLYTLLLQYNWHK